MPRPKWMRRTCEMRSWIPIILKIRWYRWPGMMLIFKSLYLEDYWELGAPLETSDSSVSETFISEPFRVHSSVSEIILQVGCDLKSIVFINTIHPDPLPIQWDAIWSWIPISRIHSDVHLLITLSRKVFRVRCSPWNHTQPCVWNVHFWRFPD